MGTSFEREVDVSVEHGRVDRGSAFAQRPPAATVEPYQRIADADRATRGENLASFLGLFSLGLGLAEVLAPSGMTKLIGVTDDEETRRALRVMGLRGIGSGVAMLSQQQPDKAAWSRVAGDAIDLAFLGKALANPENDRRRTLFATANVLAVTALDVICARALSQQPEAATDGASLGLLHTHRSITVNKPVEEVYAFWHDVRNFPRFMTNIDAVTITGDRRSHWQATAPTGQTMEWDAELTDDRPNELIAWRSLGHADANNTGTVSFRPAPGNRGTEVRVDIEYKPPFGTIGSRFAMLFRKEPGQQLADDLRHFKQMMEIGELVVSDAAMVRHSHAARPDNAEVGGRAQP